MIADFCSTAQHWFGNYSTRKLFAILSCATVILNQGQLILFLFIDLNEHRRLKVQLQISAICYVFE